jgi:hypothetical protein
VQCYSKCLLLLFKPQWSWTKVAKLLHGSTERAVLAPAVCTERLWCRRLHLDLYALHGSPQTSLNVRRAASAATLRIQRNPGSTNMTVPDVLYNSYDLCSCPHCQTSDSPSGSFKITSSSCSAPHDWLELICYKVNIIDASQQQGCVCKQNAAGVSHSK